MTVDITRVFEIELGWIPPAEVRGNSRTHWRAKAAKIKELRQSGFDHMFHLQVENNILRKFEQVRITYHFTHNRWIDIDNIAFGMKAFVDGMVDAEAVQDDTPDRVLYGDHTFTRRPKTSRTVIEIEVL